MEDLRALFPRLLEKVSNVVQDLLLRRSRATVLVVVVVWGPALVVGPIPAAAAADMVQQERRVAVLAGTAEQLAAKRLSPRSCFLAGAVVVVVVNKPEVFQAALGVTGAVRSSSFQVV